LQIGVHIEGAEAIPAVCSGPPQSEGVKFIALALANNFQHDSMLRVFSKLGSETPERQLAFGWAALNYHEFTIRTLPHSSLEPFLYDDSLVLVATGN
jgi:hypothetical protein